MGRDVFEFSVDRYLLSPISTLFVTFFYKAGAHSHLNPLEA
uniref:Uncharacterized protein n=1 Tax=Arundo donax TaxID=35708 RepID=A0A0A9BXF7_ARUDO